MKNGKLFAIGGALKLTPDNKIIKAFIESAGGINANLILVPSYKDNEEMINLTFDSHRKVFEEVGIKNLNFCKPINGVFNSSAYEHLIGDCTGVFFGGGSQKELTSMLLGTEFLVAIKDKWKLGQLSVAGTSAGCASLSETIIMQGLENPEFGTGFGFRNDIIFDQHFSSGNVTYRHPRFKRLLSAMYKYSNLVGIGVDENTSALIDNDNLDVIGEGTVTLISTKNAQDIKIGDFDIVSEIINAGVIVKRIGDGESQFLSKFVSNT